IDNENGNVTRGSRTANLSGNKPVVMLVNGNTASASEMLTGALLDNGRADVVGTKTFGKGIAQLTWFLDQGTSVQITFARYYLPNGQCIQGIGITPPHLVQPSKTSDSQLDAAVTLAQSKLGN